MTGKQNYGSSKESFKNKMNIFVFALNIKRRKRDIEEHAKDGRENCERE